MTLWNIQTIYVNSYYKITKIEFVQIELKNEKKRDAYLQMNKHLFFCKIFISKKCIKYIKMKKIKV